VAAMVAAAVVAAEAVVVGTNIRKPIKLKKGAQAGMPARLSALPPGPSCRLSRLGQEFASALQRRIQWSSCAEATAARNAVGSEPEAGRVEALAQVGERALESGQLLRNGRDLSADLTQVVPHPPRHTRMLVGNLLRNAPGRLPDAAP